MLKRISYWLGPLAATIVLVVLVVIASVVVTNNINHSEEQASFQRLAEEAEQFASSLEVNMASDRRQLELIAEMAGNYMDSGLNELISFINAYHGTGTFFSRLELLLPGDVVYSPPNMRIDASGQLSFEAEAALGAHISDREADLDGEDYVVRHFVPVQQNGETVAMLYGVIELGTLDDELPYTPYGGDAAVYVIDGATGDYLLDTWHGEQGNIWATDPRPMADGYDHEQLRRGLINGESNYVVFVSNTIGEYLYFYYTPISINQWRVALSVPESVVFSAARNIRTVLNVLLMLEAAAFLVYILWLIRYVRRETDEKQRQFDALSNIYDVEKLLFNAHEHLENVPLALEVIAHMLPAHRVAFTMLNGDGSSSDYIWDADGEGTGSAALLACARPLAGYFTAGHSELSAGSAQELRALLPGAPEGLNDLSAIPVHDTGGVMSGVLSASGLKRRSGSAAMLKSVGFSFGMLCSNIRSYRAMQLRGERDMLTGLYNRNRFELDAPRAGAMCSVGLGCIYIDANGLHELNNEKGHEAGDEMLRAIADEIRSRFGSQHAYRIGGDEFVLFLPDEPADAARGDMHAMIAALESRGRHISAGYAWAAAPVGDVDAVIKEAESRMYDDKRAYYRVPANDRRAR